jgi:hypothetical protein
MDVIFVTEIYCENPRCAVRQCEVVVKNYDKNAPSIWKCPACGEKCKVHWQRNLEEYHREELRHAVACVSAAIYKRDNRNGRGDPVPLPAHILMRDTLPDSWKLEP